MALVELEPEATALPDSPSGMIYYQRGESVVVRTRVQPTDPQTPDQLRERAGVASGAKSWGSDLTAGQRAAWSALSLCGGVSGYWLYIWVWSILGYIQEWIDPGEPGDEIGDPTLSSCSVDAESGDLTITVAAGAGGSPTIASVAVSRPLRTGRQARRTDARTMPAVTIGSSTDLTDSIVAKWGVGLNPEQDVRLWIRTGNPAGRMASCEVTASCGGGCAPSSSPSSLSLSNFSGFNLTGYLTPDTCELNEPLDVTWSDSSGCTGLDGSTTAESGVEYFVSLIDNCFMPGSGSGVLTFTSQSDPSRSVAVPIDYTFT
jgi:hypothetical protein